MNRQFSAQPDTHPAHGGRGRASRGPGLQPARRKHPRPAGRRLRWAAKWSLASALLVPIADCRETLVVPNLVAGVRDGLVTSTSGIIEDFFNSLFGLNGEEEEEESGGGKFAGI